MEDPTNTFYQVLLYAISGVFVVVWGIIKLNVSNLMKKFEKFDDRLQTFDNDVKEMQRNITALPEQVRRMLAENQLAISDRYMTKEDLKRLYTRLEQVESDNVLMKSKINDIELQINKFHGK